MSTITTVGSGGIIYGTSAGTGYGTSCRYRQPAPTVAPATLAYAGQLTSRNLVPTTGTFAVSKATATYGVSKAASPTAIKYATPTHSAFASTAKLATSASFASIATPISAPAFAAPTALAPVVRSFKAYKFEAPLDASDLNLNDAAAAIEEVKRLRALLANTKSGFNGSTVSFGFPKLFGALTENGGVRGPSFDKSAPLSVIVFGATGDLAKKKLFPALYQLMLLDHFPPHVNIIAYGRSAVKMEDFLKKQCSKVQFQDKVPKEAFYERISFHAGGYDSMESFEELDNKMRKYEAGQPGNRLYFLSIPPTIFGDVVKCISEKSRAVDGGFTHLIIEKPFGRDSQTFDELNATTSSLFKESQLYRIDHYLGKEVVLNLTTMRWANQIFESTWNRHHIESVEITFKEDLGTGGRGGYFDGFGIIRDIMQNHLLQVFMLLAMEPPSKMDTDGIVSSKVELLKCVETLRLDQGVFLGQFTGNSFMSLSEAGGIHAEPGYLEDPTVPEGSKCPTFAAAVLRVNNDRWSGVPFLMKAGKGLDERLAEVRVHFKQQPYNILMSVNSATNGNELVMRVQPDEALFLKMNCKEPGFEQASKPTVMEMTYQHEFADAYVGDAYERMFLNAAKGDGSLFVSAAELTESWRIFTPLLHEIEDNKPDVVLYPFGSHFPPGFDVWSEKNANVVQETGTYKEYMATHPQEVNDLMTEFKKIAFEKGEKTVVEAIPTLKKLAQRFSITEFNDEILSRGGVRAKKFAQIAAKIPICDDGHMEVDGFLQGAVALKRAFGMSQKNIDHGSFR